MGIHADHGHARRATTVLAVLGSALVVLLALGAATAPPAAAAAPCKDSELFVDREGRTGAAEGALLCMVNRERTRRGLRAFTADTRLTTAARCHANDMADRNFQAHDAPPGGPCGGTSIQDRVEATGYPFASYAENIAWGYRDAATTMTGWMGSSAGHCQAILSPGSTEIGIGVAFNAATEYQRAYVLVFGREQGDTTPQGPSGPRQGCPYAADGDGDGVRTVVDTCPDVADAGQADADGDGVGNACEGGTEPDTSRPRLKFEKPRGRLTPAGTARLRVRCPRSETRCAIAATLHRLRRGRDPLELGATTLTLAGGERRNVDLPVRADRRPDRRGFRVRATFVTRDAAGNERTQTKTWTLRARRR